MFYMSKALIYFLFLTLAFNSCDLKKSELDSSSLFKKYILAPIPETVKNIKADQPRWTGDYIYVLKFNVNRDDLNKIIESKPFEKVSNMHYSKGQFQWWWDEEHSGSCYIAAYDGGKKPKWFSPELPEKIFPFEPVVKDGDIIVQFNKDENLLGHSESYVFYKRGDKINIQAKDTPPKFSTEDTQVILYNNEKSEAYYIVTRVR